MKVKVHIEEQFVSTFLVECDSLDEINKIINQKYKDGILRGNDYSTPSNVLYAVEEEDGAESDWLDMDIDSYL